MPTNQEYLSLLKSLECPDSTYSAPTHPLVINKAKDSYLWDVEGHKYLDFCAGFGSLPLGHNPECLKEVWRNLLDNCSLIQGMGDVYPTTSKVELAKELLALAPEHLEKIAFAVTGSQAVELALKTAILKTQSYGFISFDMAYHGLDMGVLELEGNGKFKKPFHSDVAASAFENLPLHCETSLIEQTIYKLKVAGHGFAGIVLEPIQGRGGVREVDQLWIQNIRQICAEQKGLLILDEIWTGMGRTGAGFLFSDIEADLVCIGKGLGCGMPISACLGTASVMAAWPDCENEALHTGTFFGHALSCQVALAALRVQQRSELWKSVQAKGVSLCRQLKNSLELKRILDIRHFGLLVAVEFEEPYFAAKLFTELRKNFLIALPSGQDARVLSLSPPLTVSDSEIQEAVEIIATSLTNLETKTSS